MRTTMSFLLALTLSAALSAQTPARGALDIYVVDVEGGNATLFVTPSATSHDPVGPARRFVADACARAGQEHDDEA